MTGHELIRPDWETFKAQFTSGLIHCDCGETLQCFEELHQHWERGHFDHPKDEKKLSPEEIDRQLNAMIDALPPEDDKKSQPTLPDGVAARSSGPWDLQLFVDSNKGRSKLPRVPLPPILLEIGQCMTAGGKRFQIMNHHLNFDARCYEVTVELETSEIHLARTVEVARNLREAVEELLSDRGDSPWDAKDLALIEEQFVIVLEKS